MDVIYALLSPVLTILVLWFWKPWAKPPRELEYGEVGEVFARATEKLISAAKEDLCLQ